MRKIFLISIIIIIFASFFASKLPDGLDFVAEKLGFAEKSKDSIGIMPDYSIPFLPESGFSTALAGVSGIFILFGFFWLILTFYKKIEK